MANEGNLSEFVDELGKADHTDNDTFRYLFFQGVELLQLSDEDIRFRFGYSPRALADWRNGKELPHRGVRKVMFDMLEEQAQERLG
jgi:hypothetical protein